MLETLLVLWILSAIPILTGHNILKMVIYLGIYSLITAIILLVFGAPDVALAEASVSIFSTIFFIVCFKKYYQLAPDPKIIKLGKYMLPLGFTALLVVAFLHFAPDFDASTYAMEQYIAHFARDIGGQNAVTSIYLGYRLYDTIFEALMLMISVTAISRLSWYEGTIANQEIKPIKLSEQTVKIIRVISPLLPLFSIYLIANGHITAGGGFQGGVVLATFFVCRYLTLNINDLPVKRIIRSEKLVFASIVLFSLLGVFSAVNIYVPANFIPTLQNIFLITMNALIGAKVTFSFILLFYRFIAIEDE